MSINEARLKKVAELAKRIPRLVWHQYTEEELIRLRKYRSPYPDFDHSDEEKGYWLDLDEEKNTIDFSAELREREANYNKEKYALQARQRKE